MARKHTRKNQQPSGSTAGPDRPSEVRTVPPAAEPPVAQTAPGSTDAGGWRPVLVLLSIFAAASGVILALAWPGYSLKRASTAAEREIAARNYAGAVSHLRHIIDKYPGAWTRQTQLGDCLLELDQPGEALKAYETSLKFEPKQRLDARMGRAQFLLGRLDKALELLQKAIKDNPNDPYANYYIGLYYLERGNHAKAAFFLQGAAGDERLYEQAKPKLAEVRDKMLGGPAGS